MVDGFPVNSCVMLVAQAEGRQITTIEGLANSDELHVLQKAFIEAAAIQCGFCSPGMILAATALLRHNPAPTAEEVSEGLSGVLCLCTGYLKPVQAVLQAAGILERGETSQPEHYGKTSPETQQHPDSAVVGHALDMGRVALALPAGVPEWLSPISANVPGQLLAMSLSHTRHDDSDRPRVPNKVTETL